MKKFLVALLSCFLVVMGVGAAEKSTADVESLFSIARTGDIDDFLAELQRAANPSLALQQVDQDVIPLAHLIVRSFILVYSKKLDELKPNPPKPLCQEMSSFEFGEALQRGGQTGTYDMHLERIRVLNEAIVAQNDTYVAENHAARDLYIETSKKNIARLLDVFLSNEAFQFDSNGQSLLHELSRSELMLMGVKNLIGQSDAYLEQFKRVVNRQNTGGLTPFMLYCSIGRVTKDGLSVFKALGANVYLVDNTNNNALFYLFNRKALAAKMHHENVLDFVSVFSQPVFYKLFLQPDQQNRFPFQVWTDKLSEKQQREPWDFENSFYKYLNTLVPLGYEPGKLAIMMQRIQGKCNELMLTLESEPTSRRSAHASAPAAQVSTSGPLIQSTSFELGRGHVTSQHQAASSPSWFKKNRSVVTAGAALGASSLSVVLARLILKKKLNSLLVKRNHMVRLGLDTDNINEQIRRHDRSLKKLLGIVGVAAGVVGGTAGHLMTR